MIFDFGIHFLAFIFPLKLEMSREWHGNNTSEIANIFSKAPRWFEQRKPGMFSVKPGREAVMEAE